MLFQLFVLFIISHGVADFPLQNAFIAKFKAPGSCPDWFWVMFGHTSAHGAAVVTGMVTLGHSAELAISIAALEMVLHFMIDSAKGIGVIKSMTTDQLLHIACKLLYVGILAFDIASVLRVAIYISIALVPLLGVLWVRFSMSRWGGKI